MNRRKFLFGMAAAAVATPVVVEALKSDPDVWAGPGRTMKCSEIERETIKCSERDLPLYIGTKGQYSKYLTCNTAWHLKDYPHGLEMADWAERGRRYHEALLLSMAQTKREVLASDQFQRRAATILNDSFTVYGSSGI
jgi:hypothetical protein